jgi:hypothetical protein
MVDSIPKTEPAAVDITIEVCPKCQGAGFEVKPHFQKIDPPCQLCFGAGKVRTDVMCRCGKPVHALKGDILYCGEEDCLLRKGKYF